MKLKNCILLLLLAVITLSACKDNDNDKDILSAVNKEKISEALTNYPYDVIAVSKEYGAEDNAYDYYYYVGRSSVQLDNSFFVVKYDKKPFIIVIQH